MNFQLFLDRIVCGLRRIEFCFGISYLKFNILGINAGNQVPGLYPFTFPEIYLFNYAINFEFKGNFCNTLDCSHDRQRIFEIDGF